MNAITVVSGAERMKIREDGAIERPEIGHTASGKWLCTGAVEINNFGRFGRRYSLADVLANPKGIPWKHKNGKQRTHITDLDHGTPRVWGSPDHYAY